MLMMEITDADQILAAELGLYLVQLPETIADRKLAADPRALRAPQNWAVKSTIDQMLMGLLHFTPVDCLYATRYTTGLGRIEETVADALRWMTRLRHVRTGAYDPFATPFERAHAITECGAMATSADFDKSAAESAFVNGDADEVCIGCLAKIEARGGCETPKQSERRGSSSTKQRDLICRLLEEAAYYGRPYLMDARSLDQMSSQTASATIDALKALKARGWKGDL
jgi:hypothetical protein